MEHFSARGTEVATYDYALNNEKILLNKSVIFVPSDYKEKRHCKTGKVHDDEVESKFRTTFEVVTYENKAHLDKLLLEKDCDMVYALKGGQPDSNTNFPIPLAVHCVFYCEQKWKHGDVYAAISEDINKCEAPVVPHICQPLPEPSSDLRETLGIPASAKVFGRYGGIDTFDLKFVHQMVRSIVEDHKDIYFLFMMTEKFGDHPQIKYLEKTTDPKRKADFVSACDAMLHARREGESFGLAIAEFTSMGKPILTWNSGLPPAYHEFRNHLQVLGDSAMTYRNSGELYELITDFENRKKKPVDYSKIFSAEKVMAMFQEKIITPALKLKTSLKILCNFDTTSGIHEKWSKMLGSNHPFVLTEDRPDYWVIINKPPENAVFDKDRTIVMGMEPDTFSGGRWQWFGEKSDYLFFLDENYINNCEWWLKNTYDQLISEPEVEKTKDISAVVSSQYSYPGHKLRIDFLKELEKEVDIDIFGWDNAQGLKNHRGPLPNGKDDGLRPYRYTFAAENSQRENYVTEKLYDAILSECLCFYWGCPNVLEHFPKECLISLDIADIPGSIAIVKKCIREDEWSNRINMIRQVKKMVLEQLSFFSRIDGVLKVHGIQKRTVNLDERPEKWMTHQKLCDDASIKNIVRFSAIKGCDLPQEYINQMFVLTSNFVGPKKNTSGITGCAISHYEIWKEIISTSRLTLVMEDDVTFNPRALDRIAFVLKKMEQHPEIDIVFIGYHTHEVNYELNGLTLDHLQERFWRDSLISFEYMKNLRKTCGDAAGLHGGGTFGYIITPAGAEKMVKTVNKYKFINPVDYQIIMTSLFFGLNMYVVAEPIVKSPKFGIDTDQSDIQT